METREVLVLSSAPITNRGGDMGRSKHFFPSFLPPSFPPSFPFLSPSLPPSFLPSFLLVSLLPLGMYMVVVRSPRN
jgi:hypothetical protein